MKLPGKTIAASIEKRLKKQVKELKSKGHTPCLVAILVGNSQDQLSFVAIKKKMAKKLGIKFEFTHLARTPSFQDFAQLLKKYAQDPTINGILIQQPLPVQLQTDTFYNYIPDVKEIEGHKPKSPFQPPIGLAVLTAVKYMYDSHKPEKCFVEDLTADCMFFKKALKHKKVVLIGRGLTGGQPIGKILSSLKINYFSINSQTETPELYYKEADIIITAVGKKVITSDQIHPGVILLNVGVRKDKDGLKGDFDEAEIKNIAQYYSTTPGGLGPIDVLYLFKNVIDAAKLQIKK